MKADSGIAGISVVSVVFPIAGKNMNLGIARNASLFAADPQNRAGKIRPCFQIPASGTFDADGLAARGFQVLRTKMIIKPKGLQMPLGIRKTASGGFAHFV
jgi:hypothetical protein